MLDLRFHAHAAFLALRLEARSRAGRPIIPERREGRGQSPLDDSAAEFAVLASRRAVARLCRLNTCLTRSIVLFQLLEKHHPVRLEIGFRADVRGPEGHAWVTVGGSPLGEPPGSLDGFQAVSPAGGGTQPSKDTP